jgi:hypothetical protein
MSLNEKQNRRVLPMGWSAEEELIIKTIQQAESVPRAEAIRRMQRRRKTSGASTDRTLLKRTTVFATGRMCRNPQCTRGEDHGAGSLAHLRADAQYCNATCKKAGQRSLKHENLAPNRQCLCGSKGDKSVSCSLTPTPMNVPLKSPAIAVSGFGNGDNRTSHRKGVR